MNYSSKVIYVSGALTRDTRLLFHSIHGYTGRNTYDDMYHLSLVLKVLNLYWYYTDNTTAVGFMGLCAI